MFPDMPPDKIIMIGSIAASLYFILGVVTGRLADVAGFKVSLIIGSVLMIGSLFAAR